MKKIPLFLGVAVAAFALASCEKELEEVKNPSKSSSVSLLAKPDLLTSGSWHQTGLTVGTTAEGTAQVTTSDLFAHARPSMLVVLATYKSDGTYSLTRGVQPDRPAAQPATGQWRLNAAADSLILTQDDKTRRLAVEELTSSTLRLTQTEDAGNGKVSLYTTVFSR